MMDGLGNTLKSTISPIHAGLDGFSWWIGIVEDRQDPLHLGRCRVRIHAWHTEDKTLIPTDDLPWAASVHPVNDSHGRVSPPKEGSLIFGFFMDGKEGNFPVMMGILQGIPEELLDSSKGFSDPGKDVGSRPAPPGFEPSRYPRILNEPHTPRLARNENLTGANTYIDGRNANTVSITTADGKTWNEPKSPYAAKYPYNDVEVTESGHTFERDDTPGKERINIQHRSGTYEELQPDGSRAIHVYGSDYHVVIKDKNLYVKGSCNLNVDGDVSLSVGGNLTGKIKGDGKLDFDGKLELTVGKEFKVRDGSGFSHKSGGSMKWNGPKYEFV